MTQPLAQPILDATDISAVTQLVLAERESRDLGRWERMRECFHPDSVVRLSWFRGSGPDFVERSVDMARRGIRATHRLGPVAVRLARDRAVASLTATIDIAATISGIDIQLASHARFLFRAERRADCWRLSGFDAFYMRDEMTACVPGQVVPVTPGQLAAFRPSYRMLSFLLDSQGYRVDSDLPGLDRPEAVDALCAQVYGWAGLAP